MRNITSSFRDIKLYYLLNHSTNALREARNKELNQYGITITQAEIVYFINDLDGRATIGEIARCMSRHPHTISRHIKKLEGKGLVKRKFERNEQPMICGLTKSGAMAYKKVLKYDSIHRAMSLLSSVERHNLELYLSKVWEKSINQLR